MAQEDLLDDERDDNLLLLEVVVALQLLGADEVLLKGAWVDHEDDDQLKEIYGGDLVLHLVEDGEDLEI